MGTARAMTNNPADAFDPMRFALQCIRSICKDSPRNGQTWHDIDEIAANALSAARTDRDGWMPIETAPKDGTPMLLCNWSGPEQDVLPVSSGFWSRISDEWFSEISARKINPTHWQRLPSTPVKQEGQMG